MSIKFEPNIGERFHVARNLNTEMDHVCNKCHNTGNKKELRIYQKNNAFDTAFEYYVYETCNSCKVVKNEHVPIKTNCTYENDSFEFKINSDGFRSDEFTRTHNGKHVLFVGCSNTFGMSMKLENTWAHRLYSKINESEPLSGYYNLGHIGSKISQNISNIFLYCKRYAKPDVIFFLMPTIGRELSPDQNMELHNKDEEIFMNFSHKKQQVVDSYMMLEEYCSSNNIKLISKTWDIGLGTLSVDSTLKNFSTFFSMDIDKFADLVMEYSDNNKNDQFAVKAFDGLHAGNGLMYAESETFYKIYKEQL